MKISKFIKQLETIKKKHGDIDVNVFEPEQFQDGVLQECQAHLSLLEGDDGKVKCVTVVDSETKLAFC